MLQLSILTPSRLLYTSCTSSSDLRSVYSDTQEQTGSEVQSVIIPSADGQLGILKNHCPLVTSFSTGILQLKLNNSQTSSIDVSQRYFAVIDGFVKVQNNIITVLCRSAVDSSELDTLEVLDLNRKKLEADYSENPSKQLLKKIDESIVLSRLKKLAT